MQFSTGLRNDLMTTGDFKTLMDNFTIKIYSGTVPATADATLGAAVMLTEFWKDNDGVTRLTWDNTPTDGTMQRTTSEVAGATAAATGTASFFRLVLSGDTGALSTTNRRIQGTVKTSGGDLNVGSLAITISDIDTLGSFFVTLLADGA